MALRSEKLKCLGLTYLVYADLASTGDMHTFILKNISKDPLNISADELTEQFVRGDRARFTEGNGLGLYIAKSLTEAMDGQFSINISGDLFEVQICFKAVSL